MLRDFTSTAELLQKARLHQWAEEAERDALRREAREVRRLRTAIGNKLIAIGERITDQAPQPPVDKAA